MKRYFFILTLLGSFFLTANSFAQEKEESPAQGSLMHFDQARAIVYRLAARKKITLEQHAQGMALIESASRAEDFAWYASAALLMNPMGLYNAPLAISGLPSPYREISASLGLVTGGLWAHYFVKSWYVACRFKVIRDPKTQNVLRFHVEKVYTKKPFPHQVAWVAESALKDARLDFLSSSAGKS